MNDDSKLDTCIYLVLEKWFSAVDILVFVSLITEVLYFLRVSLMKAWMMKPKLICEYYIFRQYKLLRANSCIGVNLVARRY
jgi:hypothetical protein